MAQQYNNATHAAQNVQHPRGIIIPQQVYTPTSTPDFPRHPTISFYESLAPGVIVSGVSLARAIQRTFYRGGQSSLYDPDSRPQMIVTGQKITLRILWPGYIAHSIQIIVKEGNRNHGEMIVTKAKLVHEVAKAIRRFYMDFANTACVAQGCNLAYHPFQHLFLLELRHVSAGSFQAVLSNCANELSLGELTQLNSLPIM